MDNTAPQADASSQRPAIGATTCGYAVASLASAVAGLFILFPVGPLLGIIFGYVARADIRRSQGRLVGLGIAKAGLIVGYASLALAALFTFVLKSNHFYWVIDGFRFP